jgi:hypothetical protein
VIDIDGEMFARRARGLGEQPLEVAHYGRPVGLEADQVVGAALYDERRRAGVTVQDVRDDKTCL